MVILPDCTLQTVSCISTGLLGLHRCLRTTLVASPNGENENLFLKEFSTAGLHTREISNHDSHNDYRAFYEIQNPLVKNTMALMRQKEKDLHGLFPKLHF